MTLKRTLSARFAAAASAALLTFGAAQAMEPTMEPKTVGGAPMLPTQTIAQNASNASNLTTLVAAATAADLVGVLNGDAELTVFAPTNAAFAKLPHGTVETLLEPENKDQLTKVLTAHVVPGTLDAQTLVNQIDRAGGRLALETVSGDTLILTQLNAKQLGVTDESGGTARTRTFDVFQSNGVVHVIDSVLLPQ